MYFAKRVPQFPRCVFDGGDFTAGIRKADGGTAAGGYQGRTGRLLRAHRPRIVMALRGWYHTGDTTFAGHGEGGITRTIPLAPAGIPIGIPVRSSLVEWIPIGIHSRIDG